MKLESHFLSVRNPTATADQFDIEAMAITLSDAPEILKAKTLAAAYWKIVMGADVTADGWAGFDNFIDEWAFSHILKAVNSDANHPRFLAHMFGPAHRWFDMDVPGNRAGGGDNPDNNYMIAPVDPFARFEIVGQRFDNPPVDIPFVVSGDLSLQSSLGVLPWENVRIESDGSFRITIGPEGRDKADGPNHIQTRLEARFLFVREGRSDWRQSPNSYRIRRLDLPDAPPLTCEQIIGRAAHFMTTQVPVMYFVNRAFVRVPMNSMSAAFDSGAMAGLATQMASFGRMDIAPDEALVITVGHGDAGFRNIVLIDADWHCTFDCADRTSTLNMSQSAANADGTTTYVVSATDPGIHNWLDTAGRNRVSAIYRWQALPSMTGNGAPWIKSQLVKQSELEAVLPPDTRWITSDERRVQLTERRRLFLERYSDA